MQVYLYMRGDTVARVSSKLPEQVSGYEVRQWEPIEEDDEPPVAGQVWDGEAFTDPPEPEVEPEPDPVYRSLSYVEFITLVQMAGGMTDEQAVEVLATSVDPSIVLLRLKLEKAGTLIARDNVVVQSGLETLKAKTFINQAGLDAIMAGWPQA